MSKLLSRRRALNLLCCSAGAAAAAGSAPSAGQAAIAQPAEPGPAAFMRRAFTLREQASAAGDQGYGAVVVKDGRIVGEGPSRVITAGDPTAHAEMEAIRDAARRLGTRDLSGCVIYASSKPCLMCGTAAYWAGIARVFHGPDIADAGRPSYPTC